MGNLSCRFYLASTLKQLPPVMFETRINEISLSFYMLRHGYIGFIPETLSVYRQHQGGVWTGADKIKQLESGLNARMQAYAVCEQKYKKPLGKIINTIKRSISQLQKSERKTHK